MPNKSFREILKGFTQQYTEALKLGLDISFSGVNKIVIFGMGGSALAGEFIKTLFHPNLSVLIVKDYTIPEYIDDSYLCFCISYSGNTEETISAYEELIKKTNKVVAMCSGGKLLELSKKNKNKIVLVPSGLQPRMAFIYQALPIINILINSKLISYDLIKESKEVFKVLKEDFETESKDLVERLGSNIPIIYSSVRNEAIAMKWKISFNENAKIPAFYNVFPEFNHNELNSYTKRLNFSVLMLSDKTDHPRIKKRFNIVTKMIDKKASTILVDLIGSNRLSMTIRSMILADWVSCTYAEKQGLDPLSVPMIESLKKELQQS